MREQLNIPLERLQTSLQEQYDLNAVTLDFLPLGLDSKAGLYRMGSGQGAAYLLKVKAGSFYEPGCLVPRYLSDQGITSVVAPLPARNSALWVQLENWIAIVYPFIEGDSSFTGMTDEQWKETGAIFKQIHQVTLPSSGFELLRRETFDPAVSARWIQAFEDQYLYAQPGERASEQVLLSSWRAHQSTIHVGVSFLEKLSGILQRQTFPYVICHADLHPANLLRDRGGHVFVIDWDDVMLAPRERDFIFVREAQMDAFFQGYGQIEIDWVALTYYCWERVIQDVIECARDVFFEDDLGEETRADAARLFDIVLAKDNSNLAAAYAAAAHLPSDLIVSARKSF
jgi:spectinomycin phosphotransferase